MLGVLDAAQSRGPGHEITDLCLVLPADLAAVTEGHSSPGGREKLVSMGEIGGGGSREPKD